MRGLKRVCQTAARWDRVRVRDCAAEGPVLLTQPGQGPQKPSPARPRAPCLRSAVEPQAQGCPRPRRVEGPGIAPWSVSATRAWWLHLDL